MKSERLLNLLLQDSPRILGEADYCLRETYEWIRSRGVDSLTAQDSPLIRFYRALHAFKGMCSLMAARLPLASELLPQFHLMESRLAIRDHWGSAESWLPELEASLLQIRKRLDEVRIQRVQSAGEADVFEQPGAVKATSGGRELTFPWGSVVQFLPGPQVAGRPVVPVGNRLLAVVPSSGKAHEAVAFGVVVRTRTGQEIVVPVQSIELEQVRSISQAIRTAA